MTIVETQISVWEALAGRAPGQPVGPADAGLWSAVAERLNPARARPVLRDGIEAAELTSVRGVAYVMLRSPDRTAPCYLRLTPEEWRLAQLMDGTRTVARLVAEFAKISGRLAPDQVRRVVADLAGNHLLAELPVDAFRQLDRRQRRPWPARFGRGLLAFVRGRRLVLARIDPLITVLYRAGGRIFFTRPVAALVGLTALAGLAIFCFTWWRGEQSVFLANGSHASYATGAAILLGLNVVALACHELGHGLAVKHAGRRVPAAGFLVYFGIPSVFVDTTDVWLAGRRARLVTTASGPAAGLFLAGVAQVVGLADPALAPWCFKLSFAWYVNAAFNLNPFLALDGYYLVMDWLEIPNLRARGLSWVLARLRRRPPAFGQLDREGRLIALYGMLSLVWLVIGVNLAYRVYADRVAGLATGVWRAGWWQRGLLVLVVAGLAAPATYALVAWLGKRVKRLGQRVEEGRSARDLPRRATILRNSALGRLPGREVETLAAQATWLHPRTGSQLVFAGAAQPSVFVVVDGALEARRPGDPAGTVRERVGAGGVVGLGNALTGAASALSWYTAGTTLLALPAAATARAVGPVQGPPPAERAELEGLLGSSPAFAGLSTEDRLGLVSRAYPLSLAPGAVLPLREGELALVAAGTVLLPEGRTRGAGELVGPADGGPGHARTALRAWILPAAGGVALLLGAPPTDAGGSAGVAPSSGVHPAGDYPPLAAPPGPPPEVPPERDRRFERGLWWLLILLLLLALLFTGGNVLLAGNAWGEMPADNALLTVARGSVTATIGGHDTVLHKGDRAYVAEGDRIAVADRSTGQLTYRGGALTVLCAGSGVDVGALSSPGVRPITPAAALTLTAGRVLADTRSTSGAYAPLALGVGTSGSVVRASDGVARFLVQGGDAEVGMGQVTLDGTVLPLSGNEISCGDGTPLPRPQPSDSPSPSPSPSDSPSASPSPSESPSPSPSPTPTPTKTTKPPTSRPPTTRPPTSSPPPANRPPVITNAHPLTSPIAQNPPSGYYCTGGKATQIAEGVYANVTDPDSATLTVTFTWRLNVDGTNGAGVMRIGDGIYAGSFIVNYAQSHLAGGTITVTISASDGVNKPVTATFTVTLDVCRIAPVIG